MVDTNQVERWELQQTVNRLESAIANGAVASDALPVLVRFIEEAKRKIEVSDREQSFVEKEKRQKADQDAAISSMMARETALTNAEREQYGSFLSRPFFRKSDFNELEKFYADPWDRLSDRGKDEMSHRIWEGVRRDEYQFSELPDVVKRKEAGRLYDFIHAGPRMRRDLASIPVQDRDDFMDAWSDGRREEAYQVLDRPAFSESVAPSSRTIVADRVAPTERDRQAIRENAQGIPSIRGTGTPELMGSATFKVQDIPTIATEGLQPPLSGLSPSSKPKLGRE